MRQDLSLIRNFQVTWEKRRGLAQFLLLIGLMVLGIASKAASFDAQLSSPTLATPALGTATPQLISVDPAGEASQELDFQGKFDISSSVISR